MSASPHADALPQPHDGGDADAMCSQSWMYRSEAFAEDLDDVSPTAALAAGRSTLMRLTLPLSAVMFGVGMALVYGLH